MTVLEGMPRAALYLLSMNDLTNEERAAAAAQGWGLFHVYDMAKRRWTLNVLPLDFQGTSAEATLRQVLERARSNNAIAIKALRLIAAFNAGAAGKTKGKK